MCRIPSETWRRICNSDNTIAEVRPAHFVLSTSLNQFVQFVRGHVEDVSAKLKASHGGEDKTDRMPMIQRMLAGTHQSLPVQHIISECMGHVYVALFP